MPILIPVRGLRFLPIVLGSMLALVASLVAADPITLPSHQKRVSRDIDGVRYEFSPEQAAVVEALAPRMTELNRDAVAIASAVWTMPANDGPLSARDFVENRDAWLAASAKALGLDAPTPLQIECYDHYVQLIGEFKTQTESWVASARANRLVRTVTLWNKTDLRHRLLAGEKIPGFSTTKEQDVVNFDWSVRGAPAWSVDELPQRQKQLDALRLSYTFNVGNGPSGMVVSGRATPRLAGAPQERLEAPEPATEPVSFPFVIKPEHASLAPGEVVDAIFDKSVRGMRDSFAATTAPVLDQKSIARLLLTNLIEAGLRERVIASVDARWFSEGTGRYLAWQVARERVGADEARRVFGIDDALLEVADVRTAVDLSNWNNGEKAQKSERLAEAQGAFAAHAVQLMVKRHGDDFLARLFAEIRKTPVTKTAMRAVAQAYKKLSEAPLETLLRDAVALDAVAALQPSWTAPGIDPMPAVGPAPAAVAPPPLPHERSDLAPDPRITWGRLDNGLRYAILPHPVPTRRASIYLLVEAGGYHEHDGERSYAHFVEHMAFNGLRDFPKQTLLTRLSELGLQFGSHANATTSMFTTTYNFNDLPTDEPEALRTGVQILRNIADGILFDPKEVEQERDVILQESRVRAGGSLGWNWSEDLSFLPPQSKPLTFDISTGVFENTRIHWWSMGAPINQTTGAKPRTLRAFYDRWYRPERMVVVVVGDISAATVELMLRETFAGLTGRGPAETPPAVPDPRPNPGREPAISVTEWPQATQIQVTLANSVVRPGGDSIERRRQLIALEAALELVETRVAGTANIPASLDAWTAHDVPGWDLPLLRLSTRTEHLQVATLAIDREFRRAWTHGFGQRELERYIAKQRARAAHNAIESGRLHASLYAQLIAHATARGIVSQAPDDERALREKLLAELTPEQCRAALRAAWPWHRQRLIAAGPVRKKDVNHATISQAVLDARMTDLEPANETDDAAVFPFTDFGPPGAVSSRHHDEAVDTWFVTFANGVRLTIKPTDTERDWVRVTMNFGHGLLGTPQGKPGFLYSIFNLMRDGLEGHPEYAGAGRPTGYDFDLNYGFTSDHFFLLGEAKAETMPHVLQYFAATLTRPGNRGKIEPEVRSYIETDVAQRQRVARAVAEGTLLKRLANGHLAMHRVTLAEGLTPNCDEMRTWLKPQLEHSPLEITVVGDCEVDAVIAAVASTLGALPARETNDVLSNARTSEARPGFRERVEFEGFNTVSAVSFIWPLEDKPGSEDNARLAVLSRVLEFRVRKKLREEMGDVYAPSVTPLTDSVMRPRRLMLACTAETKPRAASRCATAIRQIATTLAGGGITDEEFQRALQPLKREAEINLRSNPWWLERLRESQSNPAGLTDEIGVTSAYARITRGEVEALAKTLLRETNTSEVIATPK